MKKAVVWILCLITFLSAVSVVGLFLYRGLPNEPPDVQYLHSSREGREGLLDINTATIEDLMTLPGIGEIYAQRIVDYRQENGPFTSIADLLNVEGFGPARLENIMDLIEIGGQHEDTGRR